MLAVLGAGKEDDLDMATAKELKTDNWLLLAGVAKELGYPRQLWNEATEEEILLWVSTSATSMRSRRK